MTNMKTMFFPIVASIICLVFVVCGNSGTYAQPFVPFPPQPTNDASNTATGNSDTFSMIGRISNIYSSGTQKFILSGDWTLNVDHGRTTPFMAKMFAVLTNGSKFHMHTITNFRQDDKTIALLDPNNNVRIKGISDVGFNTTLQEWKNVNTTISVYQGEAVSIELNENQTSSHFANQPIYGIVRSITVPVKVVDNG